MSHESSSRLQIAMTHLTKALSLLDEAQAPGDIGAHVDLALHRVRQALRLPDVAVVHWYHPPSPQTTKLLPETAERAPEHCAGS